MADKVNLRFVPRKYQRFARDSFKRFNVLVWHRRAGKTVFAVMQLILAALRCKRKKGKFAYIAPTYGQGKDIAWNYFIEHTKDIPGINYRVSDLIVEFPTGAIIRIYGADNPDRLRGSYFDGVVIDEVADMKPQTWGEIIRPALSDRKGWALFIGTPKGFNLFHKIYQDALKDPVNWFVHILPVDQSDALDPEEVEASRQTMSAAQFAQEFSCDFGAAADNSLISYDEALSALGRDVDWRTWYYSAKILGVDVARYGSDCSAFVGRQGQLCFKPKLFRDLNLVQLSDKVAESIVKWDPDAVFIDVGGIGAGAFDILYHQLGFRQCVGIQFGSKASAPEHFQNKRVEMWSRMREWIVGGGGLDEEFPVEELCAPRMDFKDARGRLCLESKESMRARGAQSPDIADALALTFAAQVMPKALMQNQSLDADMKFNLFEGKNNVFLV